MTKNVLVRNVFTGEFIRIPHNSLLFRISVYGLLIEGKNILIQIGKNYPKYNFPGGELEKGESIKEALTREFKEETGLKVKLIRLKAIKEDFVNFGEKEKSYQSILIFYEVERVKGKIGKINDIEDSTEAKFVPIDHKLKNKMSYIFKDIVVEYIKL